MPEANHNLPSFEIPFGGQTAIIHGVVSRIRQSEPETRWQEWENSATGEKHRVPMIIEPGRLLIEVEILGNPKDSVSFRNP